MHVTHRTSDGRLLMVESLVADFFVPMMLPYLDKLYENRLVPSADIDIFVSYALSIELGNKNTFHGVFYLLKKASEAEK